MLKPLFLSIDRLPDPVRKKLAELVEFLEVDPSSLDAVIEGAAGKSDFSAAAENTALTPH